MAPKESFMFTVGKVDAGMAILIGERAHLIEFPSILLPPGCGSGSIVNISVHREVAEEQRQKTAFWNLQDEILQTFGLKSPEAPKLELRNVTQTSVTLEWPILQLATAKLRSLDIYRDGSRLSTIPSPLNNTSTKISGLSLDKEYTFQLILRTTAGTYPSNTIRVRTHTITNTTGISACLGNIPDKALLEEAKETLTKMGAKWSSKIQIDTTHFVCETPANSGGTAAPGVEYQRALQLSIPVVTPGWIFACHKEKKMVPISGYYLGASSSTTNLTGRPASISTANIARPRSPTSSSPRNRQSMPPAARSPLSSSSPSQAHKPEAAPPTLPDVDEDEEHRRPDRSSSIPRGHMNKGFKFPSSLSENNAQPAPTQSQGPPSPPTIKVDAPESPTSATHPPDQKPAPIKKDHILPRQTGDKLSSDDVDAAEDSEVGETVEVDLT